MPKSKAPGPLCKVYRYLKMKTKVGSTQTPSFAMFVDTSYIFTLHFYGCESRVFIINKIGCGCSRTYYWEEYLDIKERGSNRSNRNDVMIFTPKVVTGPSTYLPCKDNICCTNYSLASVTAVWRCECWSSLHFDVHKDVTVKIKIVLSADLWMWAVLRVNACVEHMRNSYCVSVSKHDVMVGYFAY